MFTVSPTVGRFKLKLVHVVGYYYNFFVFFLKLKKLESSTAREERISVGLKHADCPYNIWSDTDFVIWSDTNLVIPLPSPFPPPPPAQAPRLR